MIRLSTFVIALALPAVAIAQSFPPREIDTVRSDARGRVGPFYVAPNLLLKELGIDSNVFNEAGEQKSDFTFTVAPKLDLWLPIAQRALLKATMASDFVWYAEYDTERSVDPQLTVRSEVYFNRITLFAEDAYLNTRQRPNHEIDLRSRHVEDTITAGAQVALTPSLSVELAGRRFETRYDTDALFDGTSLQRTLNRETRGLQLTTRHRLTPLTTLAVRYDRLQDRFEFSPERDSDSYRVMPGVEFKPQALIKGSAYLGYRKFTPSQPDALQEFSGLVGQLGLSYTLLGATVFGVSYVRDLTYSYEEQRPFFVDTSVGASIRRALGPRFDVLVSADRHMYEYYDALTAGLVDASATVAPVDITWNYAGSVGYRLGREGRIGFGVSYWTRESTRSELRDYDNLRIGSTFSYGF
jgi:hypothetical protein